MSRGQARLFSVAVAVIGRPSLAARSATSAVACWRASAAPDATIAVVSSPRVTDPVPSWLMSIWASVMACLLGSLVGRGGLDAAGEPLVGGSGTGDGEREVAGVGGDRDGRAGHRRGEDFGFAGELG